MTDTQKACGSSPLSLVIPGRPEYVVLCRLVAGALGARDSLDEETIADLKVMVTEACNCMLAREGCGRPLEVEPAAGPVGSIRMDFDSRPDAFVISVYYPEQRDLLAWLESCPPASEAGLGLTIMRALADEMVEVDAGADGTVLSLTKRLQA
jgi:anti-sigma regulatory factor (Ser/Thr protein kinase)